MKIGIAILNWNGLNLLKSHLKEVVSKSNNSCVYIIDNNSSDGSVKFVRENFPRVNIISLDKNYGFAGGYNKGLKAITEDLICIMNNDIEVIINSILNTQVLQEDLLINMDTHFVEVEFLKQ